MGGPKSLPFLLGGNMNKNIVLMGCDNTGKTTLAEALAKHLDGEYIKSLGPNKCREEQLEFMHTNLKKKGIKIYDRFPLIEEVASGVVLRQRTNFALTGQEEQEILSQIDLFILCYPGLFKVLNWGTREQYIGVKEHALDLIDRFNYVAVQLQKQTGRVREYNYTRTTLQEACEKISKQLKVGGSK